MRRFVSAAVVASVCVFASSMRATPRAQDSQARTADLQIFRDSFVEKDKSFSTDAKAKAEQRLAALAAKAGTISQAAFDLELARIAALADNGHTHYALGTMLRRYNRAPVRLESFGGEFYVLRAASMHRDLLGARLTAIDGHGLEQLRTASRELYGGIDAYRDQFAFNLLESPQLLNAAGLAAKAESATYRFIGRDGKTIEKPLAGDAPDSSRPSPGPDRVLFPQALPQEGIMWPTALAAAKAPWSLRDFDQRFRWREAPELNGLVIEIRQNVDAASGQIAAALTMFEEAITQHKPVNLVVDMRVNGGGNLQLTREFMKGLPARVPGRVFVLTSPFTFSAAISSVGYLKQAAPDRVTIVGAPVGDRLVFFAEGRQVSLPNNGGVISMATERHDYQNGCKTFTDCHPPVMRNPIAVASLAPEINAPWTIDAYMSGTDPAIDAVVRAVGGARR